MAGASVAVGYSHGAEAIEQVVHAIRDRGGLGCAVQADIGQEHQVQAMFRQVFDNLGGLDLLVYGTESNNRAHLVDMPLREWDSVLRVNLTGLFLCAREAAREFIRVGVRAERSSAAGKIVCITSVHDRIPWSGHAHYTAAMGGVTMLMKTMAQELAMHKVRVNAIAAGLMRTPANHGLWSSAEREAEALTLIPYGRLGMDRDVAKAAVWLASDEADYVTGATLRIDGGMSLYPGFEKLP